MLSPALAQQTLKIKGLGTHARTCKVKSEHFRSGAGQQNYVLVWLHFARYYYIFACVVAVSPILPLPGCILASAAFALAGALILNFWEGYYFTPLINFDK